MKWNKKLKQFQVGVRYGDSTLVSQDSVDLDPK